MSFFSALLTGPGCEAKVSYRILFLSHLSPAKAVFIRLQGACEGCWKKAGQAFVLSYRDNIMTIMINLCFFTLDIACKDAKIKVKFTFLFYFKY